MAGEFLKVGGAILPAELLGLSTASRVVVCASGRTFGFTPRRVVEMPLFFFDFTFDGVTDTDDAGLQFPSLEAAYLETCKAALDISFEKLQARRNAHLDSVEILDANRQSLMLVPFSEVLRPKSPLLPPQREFDQLVQSCRQQMARAERLRAEVATELKSIQSTTGVIRANLARSRNMDRF